MHVFIHSYVLTYVCIYIERQKNRYRHRCIDIDIDMCVYTSKFIYVLECA